MRLFDFTPQVTENKQTPVTEVHMPNFVGGEIKRNIKLTIPPEAHVGYIKEKQQIKHEPTDEELSSQRVRRGSSTVLF